MKLAPPPGKNHDIRERTSRPPALSARHGDTRTSKRLPAGNEHDSAIAPCGGLGRSDHLSGHGRLRPRTYVPITALDDRTRLLLRSRHIYILLASLLNLVLGSYYRPVTRAWPRRTTPGLVLDSVIALAAGRRVLRAGDGFADGGPAGPTGNRRRAGRIRAPVGRCTNRAIMLETPFLYPQTTKYLPIGPKTAKLLRRTTAWLSGIAAIVAIDR